MGGIVQSLQHAKDPSGGQFDPPLLKPIDPYTETNTTTYTPTFFPTKESVDCDKQYHDDYERCRNTCESVAGGAACRLKAEIKYFFCKKRRVGNGLSGMDDGL